MTLITLQDGKVVLRDGAVGTEQACCCGPVNPVLCCCEGSFIEAGREPEDCDEYVFTEFGARPQITSKLADECEQAAEEPVGESSDESPCSSAQIIVEWCGITLAVPSLDPAPATPHPLDNVAPFVVPYCIGGQLSLACFENERNQPPFGTVSDTFGMVLDPYFAPTNNAFFANGCGNRCVAYGLVYFSGNDGINAGFNGRTSFFRRDGCEAETIVGGQLFDTTCAGYPDGAGTAPCADERPVVTVTFAP